MSGVHVKMIDIWHRV